MKHRTPFFIFFMLGLLGCGAGKINVESKNNDSLRTHKTPQLMIKSKDTIITIDKTPIWIKTPDGEIKADILVLPGWNFAKEKICKESDFCKKALAKGYRLILPEMLKSVYASHYFAETREDYKSFLTLTWVVDTMIPTLQKDYGIFAGKQNYLHGISTGSRGAALVHLNTGNLFTKVVLLSGDFNNAEMSTDNLLKNTFGPFNQFKDRWIENDNPWEQSSKWSAALYIAHGINDDVVPVEQSISFADKIEKEHNNCKLIKKFLPAQHDFSFWGSQTDDILSFFED